MPQLTLIYDDRDPPITILPDPRLKMATLPIAGDLDDIDLYGVAKRLAELFLEQMTNNG